jgi:hypothetical protein
MNQAPGFGLRASGMTTADLKVSLYKTLQNRTQVMFALSS